MVADEISPIDHVLLRDPERACCRAESACPHRPS
jgi:hypothetical protein